MIRTPARRDAFLRLLREGCSVAQAARAIGVGRITMFNWRNDDPEFRTDWEDATETITENIEGYKMTAQVCRATGKVMALLLLAGCSGAGTPTVVFTTPSSVTQPSSDNPEIPGAPPAGPPLRALTNPAPDY
jgi:hypothetical protein